MKVITVTFIATLLALYLGACDSLKTIGIQGEKKSADSSNVAQDNNRPATGAQDANQPVQDVKQPANETNQRVTNTQGANRQGKPAKRSMTGRRHVAKHRGEELGCRIIETRADYCAYGCVSSRCEGSLRVVEPRAVERLNIRVTRPAENIEAVSVRVNGLSVKPMDMEGVSYSSDWSTARRINMAVPERRECPTRYDVRVELGVQ